MRYKAVLTGALWFAPIAVTFADNVAAVIRVDGASMQPCLNPAGSTAADWVLVEKLSIKFLRKYTRGEVVVLWAPDNPHQQIIKRLLALEGDTILEDTQTKATTTIKQGRCWVEGDNTALSNDSKTAYGPVHLGLLEGRVSHIVWPPSRMQRVAVQPQPDRILHTDEPGL